MSPLRWILQERPHAGGRVESKAGAVTSFQDEELSKAIPYGIYDLRGQRRLGQCRIDHETPEFAVADGGGSNGSWARLWRKVALQCMADATGLKIAQKL